MYDILLFIRPKHIHIWGMMEDIDIEGLVDNACKKARSILVGDIMTTDVITVKPETHLMMILDIMIKKHVRRIPVITSYSIHYTKLYEIETPQYLVTVAGVGGKLKRG